MSIVSDIVQGNAHITEELFDAKCWELGFSREGTNPWHRYFKGVDVTVVISYTASKTANPIVLWKFLTTDIRTDLAFIVPEARFIVMSEQTAIDLVDQYEVTQRYYELYRSSIKDLSDKLS